MKFSNFLFILLLICLPTAAIAQGKQAGGKISLVHSPLKGDDMPYPGSPMKVSVVLDNTKNSQLVVKGFFVRDGKIIEQNLNDFSTDDNDRLVYSTEVMAPLGELTYQFALMDGTSAVAHSRRYVVRRSCLPNIEPISTDLPAGTQPQEKVNVLQIQATALQNEIQNYEAVFKVLDELKLMTEK
jgi:hypothetical protein